MLHSVLFVLFGGLFSVFLSTPVAAIPSPELVIGSVSSLSQILTVAIATVSGVGAMLFGRLGIKPRSSNKTRRVPSSVKWALAVMIAGLIGLNVWQYQTAQQSEQDRLQATLVRPASFSGTKIQDETLKEKRFSAQVEHPLAISTDRAAQLLSTPAGESTSLFYDIREAGENEMGTLPGSTHVRFPDFLQSTPLEPGQSVVLFCHNGNRSSETCEALAAQGIDCRFIAGGIEKWIVEGRPFSDAEVESLSDLRAIPEYPNKSVLISTSKFKGLLEQGDVQVVDTRYPGDFEAGHLPGAVNIPIRALPTSELQSRIAALRSDLPTVAACYDRRSCFMAQVLGLELTRAGLDFRGRYTTPWDYFIPPAPKQHVQNWLADQQKTLWSRAIDYLASALVWVGDKSHLILALIGLSVITRLLILPVALKAEKDQMITSASSDEMSDIKDRLRNDPVRKARAIQAFYKDKGLTPGRNLIALLFLPVTMLGVSAAQQAGERTQASFLWLDELGVPDSSYAVPLLFTGLAVVYLCWAIAKTRRQAWLWAIFGGAGLFFLVFGLNAAAGLYLCSALVLLLLQRAYVTGHLARALTLGRGLVHQVFRTRLPRGLIPLSDTEALIGAGNKAYRLSVLTKAGIQVPNGVVLRQSALTDFSALTGADRRRFSNRVWSLAGGHPCAVRSSAANEDGASQSFAGVFESVLDVQEDGMADALDHVIASFQSARALSYEGEGAADGNVLVQQMVDAEYAGVLFTQDPLAPGMCMVEMVAGCGEDLVSGRVTPISLRFGRYTRELLDGDPGEIDLGPLLALGERIEKIFGGPQDIEWAYANGRFQIVQSRDITTLSAGSALEQVRVREWARILTRFAGSTPGAAILEQDEMSEVLPRPTPLSYSVMATLWAPGGSVDLACRDLGVPYKLPEGGDGHLVHLFGKTFVDAKLKESMTLHLTESQARKLRKKASTYPQEFRQNTIPRLAEALSFYQAVDYAKLPVDRIVHSIAELHDLLVHDIYVEAEKINILAGFTMTEARTAATGDLSLNSHLMQAELPHAPSSIMARCAALGATQGKAQALRLMGHRALFDYELSSPRYGEATELLWPLLNTSVHTLGPDPQVPANLPADLEKTIDLAIALQDLKEQAKHEALRIYAELRRAFLALGEVSKLSDLIFQLRLGEITQADWSDTADLVAMAELRKAEAEIKRKLAPKAASLTLRDCELLSMGLKSTAHAESALSGTCVSGEGQKSGKVFWVDQDDGDPEALFEGFEDGDILVCQMVHPAWLPWVQRSGAVLSQVGGWLSHMAIVAREKKVMMLVACSGLEQLTHGEMITVGESGDIEKLSVEQSVEVA
ncbi:YidC/Oxa1 family membrane protein insertase [Rhodobacteraceae bacterium M382]|nr:YidC/Oxa1 family membrane protein insertase [Rhodobacteraceae bacterium M382]